MDKWMWLVAGPNGAGKSSFASKFLVTLGYNDLLRFNADDEVKALFIKFPNKPVNDIAKELHLDLPDQPITDINHLAVRKVDSDVVKAIEGGKSFYVDTVLSTPKYRDDVLRAKDLGYKNGLVYVSVYPPELSSARVSVRVLKGGHGVDSEKAIARYHRSHTELRWFATEADIFTIHDNSTEGGTPILLAAKWAGKEVVQYHKGLNPEADLAIEDIIKAEQQKRAAQTSRSSTLNNGPI